MGQDRAADVEKLMCRKSKSAEMSDKLITTQLTIKLRAQKTLSLLDSPYQTSTRVTKSRNRGLLLQTDPFSISHHSYERSVQQNKMLWQYSTS